MKSVLSQLMVNPEEMELNEQAPAEPPIPKADQDQKSLNDILRLKIL